MGDIIIQEQLLNTVEAADYIGVRTGTLESWRVNKTYNLPYIKVGRLVKYRVSDLNDFLDRGRIESKVSE